MFNKFNKLFWYHCSSNLNLRKFSRNTKSKFGWNFRNFAKIKIWATFLQKKKNLKMLKYDDKLYIFGTIVHQIKIRKKNLAKHEIKIWAKFSHFPEIRNKKDMIF